MNKIIYLLVGIYLVFKLFSCSTNEQVGLHYIFKEEAEFISHKINGDSGFGHSRWNDGYYVQSYDGKESEVTIPDTYDDGVHGVLNVYRINMRAFINNTTLEKVTLSSSINFIDTEAFQGCFRLKNINLDNVMCFGNNSFAFCSGLEQINLNNCISIGSDAFAFCTGFVKPEEGVEVLIGSKCQTIGENAFFGAKFSGLNLPTSIVLIGHYAFSLDVSSFSLNYLGTTEEFNLITKGKFWAALYGEDYYNTEKTGFNKVTCTYGVIEF